MMQDLYLQRGNARADGPPLPRPRRQGLPVALGAGLLSIVISGCSSTPGPKTPPFPPDHVAVPMAASFVQANGRGTGDVDQPWLAAFHDAQLAKLVEEAIAHNHDLAAAAARRDEAVARIRRARASLLPILNGLGSSQRSDLGPTPPGNQHILDFQASWEVDVWGRLRSGVKATRAEAQAIEAAYVGARHSLAAQVAEAWFVAIGATQQRTIAEDLLEVENLTLRITQAKSEQGVVTPLELELARANVAQARESVQRSEAAFQDAVRGLEVLLGRYPATELEIASRLPSLPGPNPVGIPAELLERRPDLIAADRQVAAAFHRVDAARAARLPQVALSASLGTLLDPRNSIWTLGSNLLSPLLDGGARKADVQIATAQQQQSLQNYVSVALNAFREVENAMANEDLLRLQAREMAEAVDRLARAADVAQARYDAGQLSLLDLNQVQRQYFNARSSLLQLRVAQLNQRVGLYLALGGPFSDAQQDQDA